MIVKFKVCLHRLLAKIRSSNESSMEVSIIEENVRYMISISIGKSVSIEIFSYFLNLKISKIMQLIKNLAT
jgi:hypothetical protein